MRFHECYSCRAVLGRQLMPPDASLWGDDDWRDHLRPVTLRYELVRLSDGPDGVPRFGLRRRARERGAAPLRRAPREDGTTLIPEPRSTRVVTSEARRKPADEDILSDDLPIWFYERAWSESPVGNLAAVYCLNCGSRQLLARVSDSDRADTPPTADPDAPIPVDRTCQCTRCECEFLPPDVPWEGVVCGLCRSGDHWPSAR